MPVPEHPHRPVPGHALQGRQQLPALGRERDHELAGLDGHSAIFITWDEGGYEDAAPYGPEDNSGCCDSPVLPASPADPTTAGGGDLSGGTLYGADTSR